MNGASVEYLSTLNPDLIMIHHAGLLGDINCNSGKPFCNLTRLELIEASISGGALKFANSNNRVNKASSSTISFLIKNYNDYDLYSVRYGTSNYHIYGLKKNGVIPLLGFELSLKKSFDPSYQLSYIQMRSMQK